MFAEEAGGGGAVGFAREFDDGDVDRAANGTPDFLEGDAGESHHGHDIVVAPVDSLEVVDEGAVEVEKDGFGKVGGHAVA